MNRRAAWLGVGGLTLALAGAAGLYAARRPSSTQLLARALPPTRTFEPRLTHPALAAHRPYAVERGDAPADLFGLATLAELEQLGDLHGLADAYLLEGDAAHAAEALARAPADPTVRADLAALALSRGDLEDALLRLSGLEQQLKGGSLVPVTRFNRALTLRELSLPLLAAKAFDEVAAAGEPGWADEARDRAAALRAPVKAAGASWTALRKAGVALLDGGPLPDEQAVRAHPGLARLCLYDALRAAPDAARARALAPLAKTLDALAGGSALATAVEATAARAAAPGRAALGAQYAQWVRGKLDAAGKQALLQQAKARGAEDVLLGALFIEGVPAGRREEFIALARKTEDPWFQIAAEHVRAEAALAVGDFPLAERTLLSALAQCDGLRVDYRCTFLELELGRQYARLHRLPEARRFLTAGLARATRTQEWALQLRFLEQLSQLARFRLSVPLALAYLDETAEREAGSCSVQHYRHQSLTVLHRLAAEAGPARAEADATPACGRLPPLYGTLATRAFLYRQERRPQDAQQLREGIAAHRAAGTLKPGEALFVDHLEASLALADGEPQAAARLRQVISAADALPRYDIDARIARSASYGALALAAVEAGDGAAALSVLAQESGAVAPARCAVGVAWLEDRLVAVAADARGRFGPPEQARRQGLEVEPSRVLTPKLLASLEGCPEVKVLARAPLHGRPNLLPPSIAWSYARGVVEPGPIEQRSPSVHPERSRGAPQNLHPRPPLDSARGERSAALDSAQPHRLVVHDVEPPAELKLPRLRPWVPEGAVEEELSGAAATPTRVLAALREASEVELHAHGLVNLAVADESLVVLSPEADGRYALTAGAVRQAGLRQRPVVWLASCRAAQTAPFLHEPWSLPVSFLEAGARAVFASPENLPDADVPAFFGAVRARMAGGASAAVALRDARVEFSARPVAGARWVESVLLFE